MRLPFIQIAMEAVELAAPDIAFQLEADDTYIVGCLVKLFVWALARCPDDEPPSSSDKVTGGSAPGLIAKAAGYKGDTHSFVAALCQCTPAVLEPVDGGYRFKGLDRYDAAWKRNNPIKWNTFRLRFEQGLRKSAQKPRKSAQDSHENRADLSEACVTDTDTDTYILPTTLVAAAEPGKPGDQLPTVVCMNPMAELELKPTPKEKQRKPSRQQEIAEDFATARAQLLPDHPPDEVYSAERLNKILRPYVNADPQVMRGAMVLFCKDPRMRDVKQGCPLWMFATKAGEYIALQARGAA